MKRLGKAILRILLLLAAGFIIHTFVVTAVPMHGNYMYPAVRDGDLCIVYRPGTVRQNEAVLYECGGKLRIGRVVAVAGSTVTMSEEGSLMIDGFVPAEEIFYPTVPGEKGDSVEVGEGEWFILNDYRTERGDSRDAGCIKTSDIKGVVVFIFRRRGI